MRLYWMNWLICASRLTCSRTRFAVIETIFNINILTITTEVSRKINPLFDLFRLTPALVQFAASGFIYSTLQHFAALRGTKMRQLLVFQIF